MYIYIYEEHIEVSEKVGDYIKCWNVFAEIYGVKLVHISERIIYHAQFWHIYLLE